MQLTECVLDCKSEVVLMEKLPCFSVCLVLIFPYCCGYVTRRNYTTSSVSKRVSHENKLIQTLLSNKQFGTMSRKRGNATHSNKTIPKLHTTSIPTHANTSSSTTILHLSVTRHLATNGSSHDDAHNDLSKEASVIVGVGFIPGIILLFVFCRYIPDCLVKINSK